jgi:hypothetical protein
MDGMSGSRVRAITRFMVATVALAAVLISPTPLQVLAAEPSPSPAASVSPTAQGSRPATDDDLVLSREGLSSVHAAAAMEGGQTTVLADTTITRDLPASLHRCGPQQPRCRVGIIEPDAAGRGLLTVVADRSAMASLPDERRPVEGTLAYRIDAEQLKLLGPLAMPTGSPLVAVQPEAMAAADALPVGSLIAVDGWLGVLGLGLECPASPLGSDSSSPFTICPVGWITASEEPPSEGGDRIPLEPAGFGIRVQSDAYDAYAPDPQSTGPHATRPRHGTYLLRRVAADDSTDSDLGWEVVGRLDTVEGAGPPTLSATKGGLVLEVWLDRTTVPVGARLTSLVRVSNIGTRSPWWEGNACLAGPARTTIEPSRPADIGKAWSGKAGTFKRKLLQYAWRPEALIDIDVVGLDNVGCTTVSRIRRFKPGSVAQLVLAWDAVDREGRPIIPGPATVTSAFEMWKPGTRPDWSDPKVELVAGTTIEITGEPESTVPLSRYIDAALSDDVFRAWVERQRKPRWWEPKAMFWPGDGGGYPSDRRYERATEGAVDIGMFGPGPVGEVTIDTATLEVLGRHLRTRR